MKLWPFAFIVFSLVSAQASSELNTQGFASCLSSESSHVDLSALRSQYHFGDFDLLLFYLAAYPGEKLPGVPVSLQTRANQAWGVNFETQGAQLAADFLASPPRTPQDAFRMGLSACEGNVFCSALTVQNVLRTFGRYQQSIVGSSDDNPDWFKNNRARWIAAIPSVQSSMISLRTDGGGDRYGEWYHVFGILAYAIDQMALGQSESAVGKIVDLNNLLDKELTGSNEDPMKAQIDQDAVVMSWDYLGGQPGSLADCSNFSAYVNNN
jgi:hypothetical protein